MTPREAIFISAVSRELKGPRQLVANTLQFLGYEPVWQDIFGTEQGDLRAMLRRQVDGCKGVVQLVGRRYGAEPPVPDEQFGRVSYTQYEALYARQRGKKVWYLLIDESFPLERQEPEAEELRELQAAYRRRLQADSHLFHPLSSHEALEADVLKLRDDLAQLRRGAKRWAAGVAMLLVLIAALSVWLVRQQQRMSGQMTQMVMQFARVQARQEQTGRGGTAAGEGTYAELAKEYHVDERVLREKLPGFARELQRSPDATTFERANAAYVAKDYPEAERLALQAAVEAQRTNLPQPSEAIKAFMLAGWAARQRVEYADALRHLREAEKLTDRQRNPIEWADVQFDIGGMLYQQGHFKEAEAVAREDVNERLRSAGSENLDTLYSRNNLAADLERQGRYVEAEKEYRAVLAVRERRLGADHPATLVSRNNLAVVLADSGQLAEAEKEDRAVLAAYERLAGPEHRNTLNSRHTLGVVLEREGRYAEAEKEQRAVLAIQQRVLGPEDPDTLTTRNDLAVVLDELSQYKEAEKEHRAVLASRERILGPEHPATLTSRNNLAYVLDEEGNHAEAEKEHRAVLAIRERVLGPENPDTLTSRNNLAVALADAGQLAEAEKEDRAVLAIRERIFGPEHPDTLTSRNNLAYVLDEENNHAEAEREYRGVLAIRERVLGPEHPDTLSTRQNLALVLFAEGKYPEMEQELHALLAAQEHLHGSEAAETFRPRQRLAYVLYCQGKYAEAITNQQKALAVAKKGSGDEGRRQTAEAWFALSRYELFGRDFAGVLAATEAGLALNPGYLPLLAKRAHAYLFLGRTNEAEQIYRGHRGEMMEAKPNRTWEQVVLKDFDDLEKAGLAHPEFARIRHLVKTEVK